MAEETLNDLTEQLAFLEQVKAKLTGLLAGQQASAVDAAMALIMQELLSAKWEGKPLLSNLAGVDRLLKAAAGQVREWAAAGRRDLSPFYATIEPTANFAKFISSPVPMRRGIALQPGFDRAGGW